MEIYQLKTFVAVAEEAHLTRAAERLNTSQPAVSAHIKALEETLGTALFHRTPKGMVLTDEGKVLKASAEAILEATRAMELQAQKLRRELTGDLRIGLNSDPSGLKVAPFATWLKNRHPGVHLSYHQSISGKILLDLKAGVIDGGFYYGSCPHHEISGLFLKEIDLVIAGPAAWADRIKGVSWHAIASLPWVGFPPHCPYNEALTPLMQHGGIRPGTAMLSDNESTISTMVQSGIGLSIMLRDEALKAEESGTLAVWDGEDLTLPLSFGYAKKRKNEPVIQAALEGIAEVFRKSG
ncbi:LysR family transcriptional regulator [Desulfoluna butyratoxydans]|uniref:Transcription regulator hth lysr n=1 Tax=Desulfoluna butyratoxydans TaxID=231438 RepID=A0A4U8YH05_9BACT|nr:LysR family transcriptional regulator [Desulfoluna butyratoxydans]VFQ42765.1 transcription regulator hth lysr [Desulfoluna butyratoxydans]